jgi:tetratricopeptide (TPR) repeat protein
MAADGYDAFFCYSWANYDLATALVSALEDQGLRIFRDESGLEDYDPISPVIYTALMSSRALVALYTPEFPRSRYCQWELYTALTCAYGLDGRTDRVMAVLRDVDFSEVRPGRLAGLRLPYPDSEIPVVARAIAAKLQRLDTRVLGDCPLAPDPVWYPLPQPAPPAFFGRDEQLWQLHDALVVTDAAEREGPAVVQLVGVGGQGKTMLAEQYARRFGQDHPAGVYVLRGFGSHENAPSSPAGIRAWRERQVAAILHRIGDADAYRLNAAEADSRLRAHLRRDGRPYLWIVDDVPAGTSTALVRELLAPTDSGRTLITTRGRDLEFGSTITLSGLDAQAALRLLSRRRPAAEHERGHALGLAERDLGGHPQAIELASAMTEDPDFSGYADLRRAISATDSPDVLELAAELRSELPGGHHVSIAATLARSIDKLGADGRDVLRVASLLAPAPIPQALLADGLAGTDGGGETLVRLVRALADVARRSLAARLDGAEPLWSVHALITRVVRLLDLAVERRETTRTRLLDALSARLDLQRERMAYPLIADYLPHVAAVATGVSTSEAQHARNELGRAYLELGRFDEAMEHLSALHSACVDTLGEDDLTTLSVLSGLAAAYGMNGQHRRGLRLKQRLLDRLGDMLGQDDLDLLTVRNNVGVSHLEVHEPELARKHFGEVYRARRRLIGLLAVDTLTVLGNYAIACGAMGRNRLALRLHSSVYQRFRSVRGARDILTLEALTNRGASHRRLGDLRAAHADFSQVLTLRAELLGRDHPETIAALSNLATVETEVTRAADLLDEAYRRLVARGDAGRPLAIVVLGNLLSAKLRGEPGNPVPADAVDRTTADLPELEVLEDFDTNTDIRVRVFLWASDAHENLVRSTGPDAPDTLAALCHLAHATALLGQIEQQAEAALALIEDAHAGLLEVHGVRHPDTVLARHLRDWIAGLP